MNNMVFKKKDLFEQIFFICKRQNKNDKIFDEKQTRRFIEERETERINGFEISAMVQTKINISIFNKVVHICMMQKERIDQKIFDLAKKIIKNFANKIPVISSDYITIDQERELIRVNQCLISILNLSRNL